MESCPHRIIGNYPSDREIIIENQDGKEIIKTLCGVPQGYVLGPLL